MTTHHESNMLVKDNVSIQLLMKTDPKPSGYIKALDIQLLQKAPYEHLYIGDFMPSDRRERHFYVQELKKGLSHPCVLCICSIAGPIGNYLFVWPLPEHVAMEIALNKTRR